jgi:hypothetical protein
MAEEADSAEAFVSSLKLDELKDFARRRCGSGLTNSEALQAIRTHRQGNDFELVAGLALIIKQTPLSALEFLEELGWNTPAIKGAKAILARPKT